MWHTPPGEDGGRCGKRRQVKMAADCIFGRDSAHEQDAPCNVQLRESVQNWRDGKQSRSRPGRRASLVRHPNSKGAPTSMNPSNASHKPPIVDFEPLLGLVGPMDLSHAARDPSNGHRRSRADLDRTVPAARTNWFHHAAELRALSVKWLMRDRIPMVMMRG
jgi:hypothetical protein